MRIVDLSRWITNENDKRVIEHILSMDTNISLERIKKSLLDKNGLDLISINSMLKYTRELHNVIGYNLLTVYTIGNKFIIEDRIDITKGIKDNL